MKFSKVIETIFYILVTIFFFFYLIPMMAWGKNENGLSYHTFGMDFIFPVPNKAPVIECENIEAKADLIEVKKPGFFSERTEYYLVFNEKQAIQITDSRLIILHTESKNYKIKSCVDNLENEYPWEFAQ